MGEGEWMKLRYCTASNTLYFHFLGPPLVIIHLCTFDNLYVVKNSPKLHNFLFLLIPIPIRSGIRGPQVCQLKNCLVSTLLTKSIYLFTFVYLFILVPQVRWDMSRVKTWRSHGRPWRLKIVQGH